MTALEVFVLAIDAIVINLLKYVSIKSKGKMFFLQLNRYYILNIMFVIFKINKYVHDYCDPFCLIINDDKKQYAVPTLIC